MTREEIDAIRATRREYERLRTARGPKEYAVEHSWESLVDHLGETIDALITAAEDALRLREVMEEIVACRSRFSRDPLDRANFAVEHMRDLARAALAPKEKPQ